MDGFDLDLGTIEREIDDVTDRKIVLGVLDGETPEDEWVRLVEGGNALVLNVAGDLDDLAGGFAKPVKEAGGSLIHFRGFLIVAPPDVEVDTGMLD